MAGVHSALAPASTSTAGGPRGRGSGVAMHGRATLGRRPMRSRAAAMVAPVLPALTMADALPSRTSSATRTREESFLRRTACPASSSIPMTSVHATSSRPAGSPTSSGGPTSTTGTPCSSAACRAPATISPGARSPPIASTATGRAASSAGERRRPRRVTSVDLDGLAPLVPPAVRAHDMGQLRLVAVRADAPRRRCQAPVRGLAAAALGLGRLLLGDCHPRSTPDQPGCWLLPAPAAGWASPVSPAADLGSLGATQSQVSTLRSAPHEGHSPRQPSWHSGAMGSSRATASRTIGRRSSSSSTIGYASSSNGAGAARRSTKRSLTATSSSPPTPMAQRRQTPLQGALTVPVTMTPPGKDSSTTSHVASPPSGNALSAAVGGRSEPSGSSTPVRTSCQRVPETRRSRATCTTKGSTTMTASSSGCRIPLLRPRSPAPARLSSGEVLVEEPVARVGGVGGSLGSRRGRRRGLQPLAPRAYRAHEPVEHDLHAGELAIAVVLGLVAHPSGLLVGVVEDPLGHLLGLADDLGARHHPFGLGAHLFHERIGLPCPLLHEHVALLEKPPGLAELVGQPLDRRLEQVHQLVAGYEHRRREGHRLGAADDVDRPAEQLLGVELLGRLRGRRLPRGHGHSSSGERSGTPGSSRPPKRSARRAATGLGTKADTSPPNLATSRSRREAMNECFELVGMKRVSTPDSCRFIWAIWSSFSKSDTARSPFTMAVASTSRATFTTRVDIDTTRIPSRWARDSSTMCLRSSSPKSGSLFWGLRTAATTTSSKRRAARSTTSRCPLWKGSKEPGKSATVTSRLPGGQGRGPAGRRRAARSRAYPRIGESWPRSSPRGRPPARRTRGRPPVPGAPRAAPPRPCTSTGGRRTPRRRALPSPPSRAARPGRSGSARRPGPWPRDWRAPRRGRPGPRPRTPPTPRRARGLRCRGPRSRRTGRPR